MVQPNMGDKYLQTAWNGAIDTRSMTWDGTINKYNPDVTIKISTAKISNY